MLLEVGQLRRWKKWRFGDENGVAEQGGGASSRLEWGGARVNSPVVGLIPFSPFLVLQGDGGGGLTLMFDGRGRNVENPGDNPPPAWTPRGGSYPPPAPFQ